MIPGKSNISSSLSRKRHTSRMKKFFAYVIFLLFFISLIVLGLTTEKARIKSVVVSGNSSITTDDIMKAVEGEINKYYLWIIPTDNIVLLRRSQIEQQILDNFKKIGFVNVQTTGLDRIKIVIKERESKYLWCEGRFAANSDCYYMDLNGYIFEKAPLFSNDIFTEYFGLITDKNPIGQYYFKNSFKNISNLYVDLKKMSFEPSYFNALDEHEYEVYIIGGGKIIINDSKNFESSLINLQALVDNKYLKTDEESLKKIKYIDLRFGNKVNFELY